MMQIFLTRKLKMASANILKFKGYNFVTTAHSCTIFGWGFSLWQNSRWCQPV